MDAMTSMDIGFLTIAVLVSGVLFAVGAVANRFYHDRIFAGITPGLVPPPGVQGNVVTVQPGREYSGEIAVAFSPPRGLTPGLIGTIVDGKAEMRDITATIVDLAVRGWLKIEAIQAEAEAKDPKKKARDWKITLSAAAPADQLTPFETRLLESLRSMRGAAAGAGVLMSDWTRQRGDDLRGLQQSLYAETVAAGWYEKSPAPRSSFGCLSILGYLAVAAYLLAMFANGITVWSIVSAVVIISSIVFFKKKFSARVPRTAVGTAVQIQALGFKKYLATAEAEQFSFEEAAGIFSRYLPYALVFGVAAHWAKVFGEVAKASSEIGGEDLFDGLMWMDVGFDMAWTMSMFGDGGFDGLFDIEGMVGGLGDVAEGLGGFVEGIGDFISDIDFDF